MSDSTGQNSVSNFRVIKIVVLVSLTCSLLVTFSAVFLREKQTYNKVIERKRNVLIAAGLHNRGMPESEILEKFKAVTAVAVDFKSKTFTSGVDPQNYDMVKEGNDPDTALALSPEQDIASLRQISRYGVVYLLKNAAGLPQKIIFPVSGPGLWSVMYGYLSLEGDGKSISGINFYQHAETPGLGGEIDNLAWQKNWKGKKPFNAQGIPEIKVIRGKVTSTSPNAYHEIDGISGATLTGRGVANMVNFWLGDSGYGPFIPKLLHQAGAK